MLELTKVGNSLQVKGIENEFYPNNDILTYPLNSIVAVIDDSEMVTFKSAATGDTYFSGLISEITIGGVEVDKSNVLELFSAISNAAGGSGGEVVSGVESVNGQTGTVVLSASNVGAYSKSETDTKLSAKVDSTTFEELNTEVATIDTNLTALTSKVNEDSDKIASLDTEMGEVKADIALKQDELVSGTNIKTINNESILGSGNINIITDTYTKDEIDTKLEGKADNEDIPSLDGYATDTYVQTYTYDKATIDNKVAAGGTFDPTAYYNKTDVNNLLLEKAGNNQAMSVENTSIYGEDNTIMFNKYSIDNTVSKQDIINFKTINGNNILGSGDLTITGSGDVDLSNYYTKIETDSAIDTKIATLVDTAPDTLNTLNELAAALGDDPNFATTMTNELAKKANTDDVYTKEESDGKYLTEHQSLDAYLTKTEASTTYQPTLVSGTTIKTINNQSILGSGNIVIEAGVDAYTKTETDDKFVSLETYNAKITELEERIAALEEQITTQLSAISDSLDTINGETI